MRFPINWLKEYVSLPDKLSVLTDRLTMAGHMLDKIDEVNENRILDLELRGNRADCYSIRGIAREISAIFDKQLKELPLYQDTKHTHALKDFTINAESQFVKRVMAIRIKDVKITPSPPEIRRRLEEYGIPALNNIVDLTNYVMLETGQPMHAFDSEKLGKFLKVRLAKVGEEITTFQDMNIKLISDDLVWADEKSVLSVAGAVGGKYHSISDMTTHVLLEAASYNQANIRRTVHRHYLLTDAGIRHEKELDSNLVEEGIKRFLYLLKKYNWGSIDGGIFDYYPKPVKPRTLILNFNYLTSLSGLIIEKDAVLKILKRLYFNIISVNDNEIEVQIPTFRTDVEGQEDVIEEILRILSYDEISTKTLALEIPENITPDFIKQENDIKNSLTSLGFDEIISLPFVNPELQKYNLLLSDKASPITIENRPSPEIEEMRMTILPSLISYVTKIKNERGESARIFEVGKIYYQKNSKYIENRALGIAYWNKKNNDFRKFKGYLEAFLKLMQITEMQYSSADNSGLAKSFNIRVKKAVIGIGGMLQDTYFTEIYLDKLLDNAAVIPVALWPNFPPQIEDLTLIIPTKTEIGKVIAAIQSTHDQLTEVRLMDIFGDSYTFRISYQSPNRTLTDSEVDKIRKEIFRILRTKYGVTIKEN